MENLDLKKIRDEIIDLDENMLVNDQSLTRRLRKELKFALYENNATTETEMNEDDYELNESRIKTKA